VLIIVVAVAGLAFGEDAVRGGLITELRGLFGQQGGELVENLLARSSDKSTGAAASVIGVLMVLVTASGVFSEMQTALNRIWDVEASDLPFISMVRARAASLGLVATLGFLFMASLAASTAITALRSYVGSYSAFDPLLLSGLNLLVSLSLFAFLF
jgi:membrane protein